ncbi:McrB family protein, partial [Bathymodiolus thermophilus thioautotrophic gill symbiont]|uniref:McrB family protein n=1 Tax=Bathymodiolus thermophilus thioautotrophic gill symbiont TaxID=2360 RepID=UPI0015D5D90A
DKIKIKNSKDKEYTLSRNSILEYLKRQDFHETHGHYSYQPKIAKYIFEKIDKNSLEESVLKPHVLIIDEINRGNISRIFGELITLIEPSKRAGESEVISVKLPYSKEDFSVPNNLYIIGTMNTADRSLTMMDTALRRRFDFIEMAPDVGLVKGDFDGIKVGKILEFINKRIEILYDREHLIGHSFLMNIRDLSGLKNAFKNKILPLLEEYFYDDFENIRKVLNDKKGKFYQKIEVDESLFFGNENIQKDSYKKANIDELTAEDFQQIYKNQDE